MKKSESIQIGILIFFALFMFVLFFGYRFFGGKNITVINVTTENYVVAEEYIEYKININTATADELMELEGIGAVKAQAIIDYREDNGNFTMIYDLLKVNGISESMYEKLRRFITV